MIKTGSILAAIALLAPVGDEDLDKAAAKAAEMTAYTFTASTTIEGDAIKGGEQKNSSTVKVVKGSPWQVTSGKTEAFRLGESLAVKQGDGTWKRQEPLAKGEKGAKREATLQAIRSLKAPHDFLKDFGSKLKEVKREDGEAGRMFSGDLTDEAAKEFASAGFGKTGKKMTFTGQAKVWVAADGSISRLEIVTDTKGEMKGNEIALKRSTIYELSAVGSTTVDVPEDVKKALAN